jgi:hypothetical protein
MDTIEIRVNKQMDGYTFSILPSVRQLIKSWFPNAHPANNIFIGYDTKSDFELYYGKLESYIYPALLGIDDKSSLNDKVDEILFIDTQTGNVLHERKLSA